MQPRKLSVAFEETQSKKGQEKSPGSVTITNRSQEEEETDKILMLFVRLFDLRLFVFVCFLFLFREGCGL